MTIYIDIIIVENLIMNYIILYATGLISKSKISHLRIFLASAIGAIYAITEYISKLSIYSNILVKIILSIVIVFIAFNPQNVKKMCKQLILFYLTTFTFGGVATYLIYVLKPQNIIIKNGMYVGTYVLKVIFIGAILGTIILIIAFKFSKNKITKNIKENPYVGFEMDCKDELVEGKVACQYSYYYASIIGSGKASVVEDQEEKCKALAAIMKHQTGKEFKDFSENPKLADAVGVFKIEVDEYTCKQHA